MNAKQVYKQFIILLLTWITYGLIIGVIVGSTTAFLLQTNDYLGEIRENNFRLIVLLPIGGIMIGLLYKHYGKVGNNDAATGNNLVIDSVHGKTNMLKRTGPIVFISTFLTVFFGGSTGREGAAVWKCS